MMARMRHPGLTVASLTPLAPLRKLVPVKPSSLERIDFFWCIPRVGGLAPELLDGTVGVEHAVEATMLSDAVAHGLQVLVRKRQVVEGAANRRHPLCVASVS